MQVLRYEALSLGLAHGTGSYPQHSMDLANPTPAIDGPNPFAGGKLGGKSEQSFADQPPTSTPADIPGCRIGIQTGSGLLYM